MVSAINSANQYNIGLQELEVMRRLQSLGIHPTGNLTTDRQLLQKAEYTKLQNTLSANNTQDLTNLEGTGYAFTDTLNSLGYNSNVQSSNKKITQYNQTGATQLAALNRYQLGL